ncbi:MAG: hypothetical protein CW716_04660 [Candidatus Bathyarchaeum sp.]|nr:MAG: hypothetical protein CW716_04660 [Candidatus Bathyarchaeum sp.]
MKKLFVVAVFCFLLVASLFTIFLLASPTNEPLDVFVGIDVAYDDLDEIKALVDETCSYTNTIVIGSTGITYNVTKLNDACEYVYDKGMYFMIYMHPQMETEKSEEQRQWVEAARSRWEERFLGLYAHDETGGRQLDNAKIRVLYEKPANYTDAAEKYAIKLGEHLGNITESPIYAGNLSLFTSDYALYWFDYKGGYDTVFAEFGWNYSRQLNIALCRGAATAQNKEWGIMITWTYNHPPYLESGPELLEDMILAYENGAKYILVFDTNKDYTDGVLTEEHLDAFKQFWDYAKKHPRQAESPSKRVAYVLPEGYAYGFRGPHDKIWGFWEGADDPLSHSISVDVGNYLEEYGTNLDIIYDDGTAIETLYSKYIYWNGTTTPIS